MIKDIEYLEFTETLSSDFFGGEYDLVVHGPREGRYNMDFDYGRTLEVQKGAARPMFRLYGWEPWTVSLGANQKAEDIDADECKRLGFGLVRRPTGGRAVLHADELTYSVVMSIPEKLTVHDIYRRVHEVLVDAFAGLGCELEFEKAQADFRRHYRQSGMSAACFASSARYEIEWQGRKIVGSAQRRFGDVLLQHGSILLGPGHERLADVIAGKGERTRMVLKSFMESHAATLSQAAGRQIGFEESRDAAISAIKSISSK
ncbi:MAG: biotin/lipoate A/B protein ligase family protein [Candidatus Kapaibacterium sp.]